MEIAVFYTNVETREKRELADMILQTIPSLESYTIDCEDDDRVLRTVAHSDISQAVVQQLSMVGIQTAYQDLQGLLD